MKDKNLKENEYYKDKIIEMVRKIKKIEFLEKIYYFVKEFIKE